jgi:hypothetical protein
VCFLAANVPPVCVFGNRSGCDAGPRSPCARIARAYGTRGHDFFIGREKQ